MSNILSLTQISHDTYIEIPITNTTTTVAPVLSDLLGTGCQAVAADLEKRHLPGNRGIYARFNMAPAMMTLYDALVADMKTQYEAHYEPQGGYPVWLANFIDAHSGGQLVVYIRCEDWTENVEEPVWMQGQDVETHLFQRKDLVNLLNTFGDQVRFDIEIRGVMVKGGASGNLALEIVPKNIKLFIP